MLLFLVCKLKKAYIYLNILYIAGAMNFSELFRQSNQICRFSPDGKYLASVVEFRLVIRDVDTFQVCQVWFLPKLKSIFFKEFQVCSPKFLWYPSHFSKHIIFVHKYFNVKNGSRIINWTEFSDNVLLFYVCLFFLFYLNIST